MDREKILERVDDILERNEDTESMLKDICRLLHTELDDYDWVGFYLVENDELVLGPFVGESTEHTNIDFGEGICGQAAESKDTFVVDDVSKEDNYLSCSVKVQSEIVIPIFKDGEIAGEIDIDSHQREAFSEKDKRLLEDIAAKVEKIL